ncbi:NAD-dependent succinate-semialdehyde dehydrogenase [Dankookia rubra]|uniref:NAD-dependent succinate-semialdehyde dehydrogenase n=1 Tax=Dankookia rubra TaxID=1442381 RepID=A0A4R5QC92_9PROT|nr:NAD-dependent succinate-semialdehyde dehydrogenase [Dankookia rubra]TDH59927.1 NAD-dependent succinate-semialdehyde dehydrogenase [Dankookia rubra]
MIITTNPATGEELARYEFHTPAEVDATLAAAVAAQRRWAAEPVERRTALLRRIAGVLRANRDRYARLITEEMGKPIVEAEGEIDKCALTLDYYAENAPRFLADEPVATSAFESAIVWDPLGVVLAIMPWNYPFWQLVRFLAPTLAAGNGAVLKHANNVPGCALAIREMMREADAPEGLLGVLFVDNTEVAGIIADDRIAAVTLTGSTAVGSIVAAQAGRALKPQVLELGGSDPFIVLADADIEAAAKTAVKARFSNTGQSCISAKRFIVVEAVAEAFAEAFRRHMAYLVVGNPMDRQTTIGAMARENLRDTLHAQVEASVAAGACLVAGGRPVPGRGFFYEPTLLDGVAPEMVAFCEETFGPAAAIVRARDTEDAIRLANQTEFGLGAALWTGDLFAAKRLVRRIEAGAVFVNALVASDPRIPFGGIKKSGYGRELGALGMRAFLNAKTIWIGTAEPATSPRKPLD